MIHTSFSFYFLELHFFKSDTKWVIEFNVDGSHVMQWLWHNWRKTCVTSPKSLQSFLSTTKPTRIQNMWSFMIRAANLSSTKSFKRTLSRGSSHWQMLHTFFCDHFFHIDVRHHVSKCVGRSNVWSFFRWDLVGLIGLLIQWWIILKIVWIEVTSCLLAINLHFLDKTSYFSCVDNIALILAHNLIIAIWPTPNIFHKSLWPINSYFLDSHSWWLYKISFLIVNELCLGNLV